MTKPVKHSIVTDDVVGTNGDTFTLADLTANDKLHGNGAIELFFGTDPLNSLSQNLATYLSEHGIIWDINGDGLFHITANASDFQYSVKTSHDKWDTATVHVIAPQPPPPPPPSLLFSENFDNFGQTAPVPYVADLAQHGWTNVNNGGETTVQLLPKDSSMDFYLNTRDTDGFELLIGNTFKDPTGGKAMLSFDFSTLPGMNVQDSLIVMTDNIFASNIVASFKGADLTSGWHHADIVIDTGGTPDVTHSFFINERGNPPSISSTGFAVDNIQIHDYLIV